ncbi:MAG: hypothetical protein BWX85_00834 [Chloroflexi bacterium ADurb.Bin120]|nr:MAG: hypothetical protein BWX85_00834 [Chloroflexi bacterium ADurb.Bin120]
MVGIGQSLQVVVEEIAQTACASLSHSGSQPAGDKGEGPLQQRHPDIGADDEDHLRTEIARHNDLIDEAPQHQVNPGAGDGCDGQGDDGA